MTVTAVEVASVPVKVTISYEDVTGKSFTLDKEVPVEVAEVAPPVDMGMEDPGMEVEPEPASFPVVPVVIGAVALIALLALILIVRAAKRRKARREYSRRRSRRWRATRSSATTGSDPCGSPTFATSTASLRQRPFRTLMTVLGVVIGTTSVVVMVSLGIGVTQSTMDSMASNATLRQVSVYGVPPDAAERGLPTELNEQLVAQVAQYPGVDNAWPIYNVDAIGQVDGASQWFQIQAVPQSMIDQLDLPLAWGSMPDSSESAGVLTPTTNFTAAPQGGANRGCLVGCGQLNHHPGAIVQLIHRAGS